MLSISRADFRIVSPLSDPIVSLIISRHPLRRSSRRGGLHRDHRALHQLNIFAALHDNRTRTRTAADDRADSGSLSAARDRSDDRTQAGSDPSALRSFFRLTVALGSTLGVDFNFFAVLIFDRLQVAREL